MSCGMMNEQTHIFYNIACIQCTMLDFLKRNLSLCLKQNGCVKHTEEDHDAVLWGESPDTRQFL
jgi:hypothetical protein